MNLTRIDDASDTRLAGYRSVPDAELLASRGLFIAEGRLVVRRLLSFGRLPPQSVMVTEPARAALADALDAHPDLPVYLVPQRVMDGVAGYNVHRGCLALGARRPAAAWQDTSRAARRLVILERLGNADNVGALFRNAAAFGFDAVLVGPACADPLYRKAIRTSMGASLTLPFAPAEPWPDVLRRLREDAWVVVALVTDADAPPLATVLPGTTPARVAVVVGHEGDGLTREARGACTHHARIPMAAGVDSLNAATAAAIAFYEMSRAAAI